MQAREKNNIKDIAIVGVGCRFPNADNPKSFWELLSQGVDAISEIPPERWDINDFYDRESPSRGKMNTRWGGFLKDVDRFDPSFFGITPREAERMDPQQRILLEIVWESLEDAGIAPSELDGSKTGVFIGFSNYDYGVLLAKKLSSINAYNGTGNSFSILANRISYLLNLRGPSISIDTACSSSLVAINLACQSLLSLESNVCLVGGINLILTPETTISLSQAGMMAANGRCKTFDANADGYVRGEGGGIVVLKRLEDAVKDGDNIQAVIKGSAINQDGLSNGITAPNGPSQQEVIFKALKQAGVEPSQLSYVETHGTGTSLGDPIEVNSLKNVLMNVRELNQPCWIGSVKTNIGHLEAAAGIASLIKVVLSLQHEVIPPHLNFNTLNPYIRIENTPIKIPTSPQKWANEGEERIAGISSFGFGGTNSHVIVAEAPIKTKKEKTTLFKAKQLQKRSHYLLTLSGKCESALLKLVQKYQKFLENNSTDSIADICFTAATGRNHFSHRLAFVAESIEQLLQQTKLYDNNKQSESVGVITAEKIRKKSPKVAFLFTDQGSQYADMGKQLYQTQPIFRQTLEECSNILSSYLDLPLLEVIFPTTTIDGRQSLLDQTKYTQPALFAIEYSLYKLWQSWGIKPGIVMGHSIGEYVAACVAGVFSLEDGLKLIAHRGKLMQELTSGGKMISVIASEEFVNQLIASDKDKVSIAAINGAESTVISGQAEVVQNISQKLEAEGIKTKQLKVSNAFHSPLMKPMLKEFEVIANQITYHQTKIPFISNLTGKSVGDNIAKASYWVNHVCEPVKFAQGMEILKQEGYSIFLEIGAKPILLEMGRQCLPEGEGIWLPSLRSGYSDWQQILSSLAKLYVEGVKVDWSGLDRDCDRHKVVLPTYPFQRQRYWIATAEKISKQQQTSTQIIDLINRGETKTLVQQLKQRSNLSQKQQELLPDILKVLVKENQKELDITTIKDWLYQVEWKPIKYDRPTISQIEPSNWLIFADETGVAEKIAKQLERLGVKCNLVYRGDRYQQLETGAYQLNPKQPEEFEQLIKELQSKSELPLQKVIHLWSLDVSRTEDLTLDSLKSAQIWGCGSVLHLVQAIIKTNTTPQLWLVTRGAQSVLSKAEKVSVAASPLWGMGRVVSLEFPQLLGGLVDLDPEATETETETLLKFVIDNDLTEDHLVVRGEQSYVARLVKQKLQPSPSVSFKTDATYLITGGLGALGLHTARWMVEKGAQHLVIISRSKPSQGKQATISDLQQKGAEILVVQADVANVEELSKIIEQIDSSMPPLKGIIHSAGVRGFQLMQQMKLTQFDEVMAGKVMGGWILHQLSLEKELDFFVNFSSIAAVWGSAGQVHYGAANQFLDGLTHYRRAKGLPSRCINWGPWSRGGMVEDEDLTLLRKRGVEPIFPKQGIAALEQLWANGNIQTTVAKVDWGIFKPRYEIGSRRLLLEEIELESLEAPASTSEAKAKVLVEIEAQPESERIGLLTNFIQKEVGKVLGLDSAKLPNPEQGFYEMGMDSLMALELHKNLGSSLGLKLPATLTFHFSNIKQLSQHLGIEVLALIDTDLDIQHQMPTITSSNTTEPIAIIGMSCRFPGGATDPERFWNLLESGINAKVEVPQERWDIEATWDPNPEVPGKMYTRYGNFLDGVDQFDSGFFGISPREASAMDPQQRLLLEVSWEALEEAGSLPERLKEESVGVFVGNDGQDYKDLVAQHIEQEPDSSLSSYIAPGNALSSQAGRLAYTFGFTGPTMTIDTACSSSLVAIHQACSSLRLGECHMAIAGGVKLYLSPSSFIALSKTKMLSPDGLCKTFDASADGMSRGEGCGMVVLKPLSDAKRDGDNVLAVIRGSAVNQDGPSSGLTVPNGQSQQRLIRQALASAQVEPAEISYLEAHGTGTSLGDPIEVTSAIAVLGEGHSTESPLYMGSVKTNIGHLEAAAGVSGLIKVVLAMQHKQIPPHLNFHQPNPKIDWETIPIKIPITNIPWHVSSKRIAGISSFGFTGTNAHVVLEEAPVKVRSENYQEPALHLLTLSAKTAPALAELVNRYQHHLEIHRELELADICYTANLGRAHFNHRLAITASNQEELSEKLMRHQSGEEVDGLFSGELANNSSHQKVAFLFTGQGSQYLNMGAQLYQISSVFREAINKCNQILSSELEHSLLSVLYPEHEEDNNASLLDQTIYTQPALFAIEYALTQLWKSWGITPDIVMGHSLGEYVAATVAGVFSLEEGLKLIAARGRIIQQLPKRGKMVSVMASESKIEQLISSDKGKKMAIAAINGPESVVISGETKAVDSIVRSLKSEGIRVKTLQISHAFHSPLMSPILAEFEAIANQITYNQPRIPLISNVTGARADSSIATASYWVNHVCQSIRFSQSIDTLHQEGCEVFLEIGPKPILLGMGRECLIENQKLFLPSLHSGKSDWLKMVESLGQLYAWGFKVDWQGFVKDYPRQKIKLPTYPFQRKSYWIQPQKIMSPSTYSTMDNNNGNSKVETIPSQSSVGKIIKQQMELMSQHLEILRNQNFSENKSLTSQNESNKGTLYQANTPRESNQKLISDQTSSSLSVNLLPKTQTVKLNPEALETVDGKSRFGESKEDKPSYVNSSLTKIAEGNNQDLLSFSFYYFGNYQSEFKSDKYNLLFEGARFADQYGFSALWMPERHFHSFGGFSPNPSVIAAALARETKNIQLRAGSIVLPLHHPIRVAEEWSVVDNLSQGRVGISFASGWNPNDFVFAPESFGKHREIMFQGIETIKKLWRGDSIEHIDGTGKKASIKLFPMPMQSKLSTWITAVKNPDTYIKAGEIGAGVLTNLMGQTVDELETNITLYREALNRYGHNSKLGHVTVLLHTFVGTEIETVRSKARQPFYNYLRSSIGLFKTLVSSQGLNIDVEKLSEDDLDFVFSRAYERYVQNSALIGTPESCKPIINKLKAIGVDEIACFIDFGIEGKLVLEHLDHLHELKEYYQQ